MYTFGHLQRREAPPQTLGQEPQGSVVLSQEGLQVLTPKKNEQVRGYLSALYFASPVSPPAGQPGTAPPQTMIAMSCQDAQQRGGNCTASALQSLASAGAYKILVDYVSASPNAVTVTIVTDLTTAATLAAPGTALAVFNPEAGAPKKEEKKRGGLAIAAGAIGGGLVGFVVSAGNPVGAAVGAAVGAGGAALI